MNIASLLSEKNITKVMNKLFRPKFWKFYFWLLCLSAFAFPSVFFQKDYGHLTAYVIDTIYCIINALALYVFIYKKPLVLQIFWKLLFLIDFIYQVSYIAFQVAPNAPILRYLSILSDDGKPSNLVDFSLNILLSIPLLFAIYHLSKGKFLISKKINKVKAENLPQNTGPQWGRFAVITLLTELNIFLIYVLLATFKVFGDAVTIYSNVFANYLGIAFFVAAPFVIYILKFHQRKIHINIFSIKMALILLFGICTAFAFVPKQTAQVNQDSVAVGAYSSDDLMKAINLKRKQNNVNELKTDKTTCLLAKVRMDQVNKYGFSIVGDNASLDRALEQAFGSDTHILDWYVSYGTYQVTTADALKKWSETSDKDIFTNTQYQYGCAVVENGFGVVITGYNDPTPTPTVDPANKSFY